MQSLVLASVGAASKAFMQILSRTHVEGSHIMQQALQRAPGQVWNNARLLRLADDFLNVMTLTVLSLRLMCSYLCCRKQLQFARSPIL